MDFPDWQGTYTNESDIADVEFLYDILVFMNKHLYDFQPFFVGMCYYCIKPSQALQCCGGSQLVAYCSRDCQKKDRAFHKKACKEFPVVDGKNVLHTTGPWGKHIVALRERAAKLPYHELIFKSLFSNPRVCRNCHQASPSCLTDCVCLCVSYCSKRCAKADTQHKKYCNDLNHVAGISCLWDEPSLKPDNLDIVYEQFTPVSKWNDVVSPQECAEADCNCCVKYSSATELLSYAMSLLYALQKLPGRLVGSHTPCPLEDLTSLTIHVVTSNPLFNSCPWEIFMHRLPNLQRLNIVFVMQGKGFKNHFNLNYSLYLKRCDDCQVKNRYISYFVQQKLYHMFFSSTDYTDPDVIVVYGNNQEMSMSSKEEAVHSKISYGNMTYSKNIVLVLMDSTMGMVKHGVKTVNAVQPIEQLVPPQVNPLKGFSSDRDNIESNVAIINEKHYFACVRRK